MAEAACACSNRRRGLIGSWVTPPTTGAIEIERGGDENITINHGCRHNGDGRHDDSKGWHGDGKRQQGDGQHDDGDGRHDDGKGQQGVRRHDNGDGRHDDGKGQQGDRRHDDGDGRHDNGKGQQGDGRRQRAARRWQGATG